MANDVFANGLEISCKSAGGKSIACFPDVCFTPPSPPGGWIPIPYANTSYAKDTTNASKTVFISGKPIMKKDVSFFKTSTGNEAAAGPKGIITGVKKGKAYFTSWSMNIKVEGENVDRHTDLMTHNHGSTGNTSVWAYTDTRNAAHSECGKECIAIERKCSSTAKKKISTEEAKRKCAGKKRKKPEEVKKKNEKKNENIFLKKKKGRRDIALKAYDYAKAEIDEKLNEIINWKLKNCTGLLLINSCVATDPKKLKAEVERQIERIKENISSVKNLKNTLPAELKDAAMNAMAAEFAAPTAGAIAWEVTKSAAGRSIWKFLLKKIPFVGTGKAIYDANEMRLVGQHLSGLAAEFTKQIDNQIEAVKKQLGDLKTRLVNEVKMFEKMKAGDLDKAAYEKLQTNAAAKNSCLEARKCNLVPYTDSESKNMAKIDGCCPGQTGHHVVPGSTMRGSITVKKGDIYHTDSGEAKTATEDMASKKRKKHKNEKDCLKYSHKGAPTVCVEGTSQHDCDTSHGNCHNCTADGLRVLYKVKKKDVTLEDAIETVSQKHVEANSKSNCTKKCIKAQLTKHYTDQCGKSPAQVKIRRVDGKGDKEH